MTIRNQVPGIALIWLVISNGQCQFLVDHSPSSPRFFKAQFASFDHARTTWASRDQHRHPLAFDQFSKMSTMCVFIFVCFSFRKTWLACWGKIDRLSFKGASHSSFLLLITRLCHLLLSIVPSDLKWHKNLLMCLTFQNVSLVVQPQECEGEWHCHALTFDWISKMPKRWPAHQTVNMLLEVQLVFHKGHVCTCGQLEVQLSQWHGRLWRSTTTTTTTTSASSTAVLTISNKLICFNKQTDLFIQHLLEIIPGNEDDSGTGWQRATIDGDRSTRDDTSRHGWNDRHGGSLPKKVINGRSAWCR